MGQGNVVDESLPTPAQLAEADECEIFDKDSKPLKFSSIRFSSKTTIVLFVRHWGCGLCSGYLDEVIRKFKPLFEEGSEESKRIQLIVIGHGGPEGIERYRKFAGNIKCEIYADPEKKLYKALGIVNQLKEMGIGVSIRVVSSVCPLRSHFCLLSLSVFPFLFPAHSAQAQA